MLLKFIEKNHENKLLVSLIPLCHLNINFYVIMHNFKIIIKIQNTRQHVHWFFFAANPNMEIVHTVVLIILCFEC